jgi:hypothetical protein
MNFDDHIPGARHDEPDNERINELRRDDEYWTTEQLREQFEVLGFQAPFVAVRRKSDGAKGSLEFTHSPRVYFNFVKD